jgi:PAS domain S-box-containing protein
MIPELDFIDSLPVAAFATDGQGRVVRYNDAAALLWGHRPSPDQRRWTGAWRLLATDGAPVAGDASPAARTFAEGRPPEWPAVLVAERPDGSRRSFMPRPALLADAAGRPAGVLELMLDVAAEADGGLAAERLAAIISSSDDAIIGKSLDDRVTSWNHAAERIFGWTAEEMVGQPISRIIPPELLHEEETLLTRVRNGSRIEHFDTERITRDGRRIAISLTVSPILNAAGQVVGASKISRDISARRRSETTQRQLIEELNHRVRNTLAMIQAIARQSLRSSPGPEAFAESFGGRVQALARAHDLLVAGEMAGAELGAILSAELAAVADGAAARVEASGPAVMLEPRLAVQMALILHELASNARRHGALSGHGGRVLVDWVVEAGPDVRRLGLVWRERGGPGIIPEAVPGFGFALIERSLTANAGSTRRRFEPAGLVWELGLPLPELPALLPGAPGAEEARPSPPLHPAALDGRRVLVVEDEPLIALEVETELVEAGAEVVGPAGSVEAALALIESESLDAVLLDANLAGRPVDAVAGTLAARGIPFAFASGYGPAGLPEGFRDRPLIGKPFGGAALVALVEELTRPRQAATVIPLRKRE